MGFSAVTCGRQSRVNIVAGLGVAQRISVDGSAFDSGLGDRQSVRAAPEHTRAPLDNG